MTLFAPKKVSFCLIIGFLAVSGLSAQDLPLRKVIDDSSLRISLKDSLFIAPPAQTLRYKPTVQNLAGGGRVEMRVERSGRDEFMVILARELTGAARSRAGAFPGWAQGSWVLSRRMDTGAAVRIRVFLRSDPYTYVQFTPLNNDKCQMDVVLYEAYLNQSLPIPIPFERLYTMPLEEILNLAGDRFPRKYFEPDPANYREERLLVSRIREKLPPLQFADDGAIDESGNYVYIDTGLAQGSNAGLNCSGFAKWLIDGILHPITGDRLPIAPLKAPFGERGSSFTDLYEEARDPFFGLDWIRNLASQAAVVLASPAYSTLEEIEVRSEPFTQVIARGAGSSAGASLSFSSNAHLRFYPGFLDNAGYGIEGLQPLLYTLAIDEPGRFYLAAVNNEMGPLSTPDNLRGSPRMRQYFHVAVLIPYFNEYGVFHVAVFESAAETSFNAFRSRYPGHCVNLVRVPVQSRFEP